MCQHKKKKKNEFLFYFSLVRTSVEGRNYLAGTSWERAGGWEPEKEIKILGSTAAYGQQLYQLCPGLPAFFNKSCHSCKNKENFYFFVPTKKYLEPPLMLSNLERIGLFILFFWKIIYLKCSWNNSKLMLNRNAIFRDWLE